MACFGLFLCKIISSDAKQEVQANSILKDCELLNMHPLNKDCIGGSSEQNTTTSMNYIVVKVVWICTL